MPWMDNEDWLIVQACLAGLAYLVLLVWSVKGWRRFTRARQEAQQMRRSAARYESQ